MRWESDVGYRVRGPLKLYPRAQVWSGASETLREGIARGQTPRVVIRCSWQLLAPTETREQGVDVSGSVCGQCGSCPRGLRCLWELGYAVSFWDSPAQGTWHLGSEA